MVTASSASLFELVDVEVSADVFSSGGWSVGRQASSMMLLASNTIRPSADIGRRIESESIIAKLLEAPVSSQLRSTSCPNQPLRTVCAACVKTVA